MLELSIKSHQSSVSATRPPRARIAITSIALFAALTAPADAERADREKPINLEADKVTVDDKKQTSTFEGGVVMIQGTMRITADRVIVRQDKNGIQTATAYGKPATFKQKRDGVDEYVEGFAERAEYDGRIEKLELFDNAILKRGQDEVRGNYITYEVTSEFLQVFGNHPQATTSSKPGARVKAVFQPTPKKESAGTPASKPQ
jgi:lipopolysaccharide export system protein LptA